MTITEAQLCREREHKYSLHWSKTFKTTSLCLIFIAQTFFPWLPESLVEHSG